MARLSNKSNWCLFGSYLGWNLVGNESRENQNRKSSILSAGRWPEDRQMLRWRPTPCCREDRQQSQNLNVPDARTDFRRVR